MGITQSEMPALAEELHLPAGPAEEPSWAWRVPEILAQRQERIRKAWREKRLLSLLYGIYVCGGAGLL